MSDHSAAVEQSFLSRAELERLAATWRGKEISGYTQEVRMFDFSSYGKPFTQVALVLRPKNPLVVNGRRVVVVASEGGHDNGREFVQDNLGREGPGVWLARRGVTFIALCRLGRWNFLSDDPLGSWSGIPLSKRMPIFHRGQKEHWAESEYVVTPAKGVSSPTGSEWCRLPRSGSDLEAHMMALTPKTQITGFETALAGCSELHDRSNALLLYWGFSTGGAFLWALSKSLRPDGIMGFGMTNFPVAHFAPSAAAGDHRWLYDTSAFRVRERGKNDFAFYTSELPEAEREKLWVDALHAPRFKSHEDTFMFFNVAAQCETLSRLWNAGFLPEDVRKKGFSALLKEHLDLNFPDESLSPIAALELTGTKDEILPPDAIRGAASVVSRYCRRYHVTVLEGIHHSVDADQAERFGSVWLEAIASGYFDPEG